MTQNAPAQTVTGTPSNEFLDELDRMARQCGESEWSLIGTYATPKSIVPVSDDDVCGGALRDAFVEIRAQAWDPLLKTLRSAGHTSLRKRLEVRLWRHQAYDCSECEFIWGNASA